MTQKPNLIGVAGRIGSGKDTVGAIIQFLMSTERCEKGILGKQHVTSEEWLSLDNLYNTATTIASGWQVKKFAAKLKQIASLLTGIPADQFENQEFKSTALGEKWSYYEDGCSNDMTVRLFLQKLGTEAIRNGLHTNAWVNALFADYRDVKQSEDGLIHEKYGKHDITIVPNPILWSKYYPNWIITDLRFPNEFEAIKDRGGVCIRVHRLKDVKHWEDEHGMKFGSFTKEEPTHTSETALDNHKMDYVLNNSGSIDDLVKEIRKMLVHFNLIES